MLINKKNWWVYAVAILFILLNAFFISREFYFFGVVPVIILLVIAAFVALDKLLLFIVFLVPLSVPLSELVPGLPIDMFLPTEPLLAGILLLFIFKLFFEGSFDKRILTHPISIAIYLYFLWMLVTTITSTMPAVSIKVFVSRLWFIVAFYFLATQLFQNPANAQKYFAYYAYGLVIVVIYALFRHATYGIFDQKIAHWSANPFYKDHTSYGAILALYIPPITGMVFLKNNTVGKRLFLSSVLFILFAGLVFSYTRAAWVSLLGAIGIWIIIKLRIRLWIILSGVGIVLLFTVLIGPTLIRNLQSNKQDSSTNLTKHVQSISNVSTDASNLERINRWNCAIRMFEEKPVFGWGPGTYMFKYAPFQRYNEKTIISTNRGDMGNAHSEYLGPLSEQGFMGPILFAAIVILTLFTGFRVIKQANTWELKTLSLAALLGLTTYYMHGILNNFLDTDKLSAPFWGFTALIVAIDVYHSNANLDTSK